jgi:hypothetical protein
MMIQMSTDHTIILLDVATRVAERVCTDPLVAALLEPAVCIAADDEGCNATFVERLEVIGLMNEFHTKQGESVAQTSVGPTFAVLIADKSGATIYTLPDPRIYPQLWPWMQTENDEH